MVKIGCSGWKYDHPIEKGGWIGVFYSDYSTVEYEKTVEVIKTTIKIPEELQQQLTAALESALWDTGFITKETPEKDKEVYPVKYITLDDGKYRIVFAVEVKERKKMRPK